MPCIEVYYLLIEQRISIVAGNDPKLLSLFGGQLNTSSN